MSSDSGDMKKIAASYLSLARGKTIPMCLVFLVARTSNYGCWLVYPFLGCLPELAVLVITAVFGSAAAAPGLSSQLCFLGFCLFAVGWNGTIDSCLLFEKT